MEQNLVIITDFSKTLTASRNPTTWSVLAQSGILGEEYTKKRGDLYNEYYHFEVEKNIDQTHIWFAKHLELMGKSGLTKEKLKKIVTDKNFFEERKGLLKFFEFLREKKAKVYIITSGIVCFIEEFFEYLNFDFKDILIFGNKLTFDENGNAIGCEKDSVFTPLESKGKFEKFLEINEFSKVFLLGDKPEDMEMYSGKSIKIGFNEDFNCFDVNLGKKGNLEEVIEIIKKNYEK